jgi:hypothetical protein
VSANETAGDMLSPLTNSSFGPPVLCLIDSVHVRRDWTPEPCFDLQIRLISPHFGPFPSSASPVIRDKGPELQISLPGFPPSTPCLSIVYCLMSVDC